MTKAARQADDQEAQAESTVFVVDDDADVRRSLRWMLCKAGLSVETYASAEDFLDSYFADRAGCVVADVRMPGIDGLALQQQISQRGWTIPIIIITGHGDVPMAVQAMRDGAIDFIEKPFERQAMLERIHQAIERDARSRRQHRTRRSAAARVAELSSRERQVMHLMVRGALTKQIARQLNLSARTVEKHREHVMEKMEADSLAELVLLGVQSGIFEAGGGGRWQLGVRS